MGVNISLSNSSTSVKVMPEGALYWYGNECNSVAGGWIRYYPTSLSGTIDHKTNSIEINNSSAGVSDNGIVTQNMVSVSGYSKVVYRITDVNVSRVKWCMASTTAVSGGGWPSSKDAISSATTNDDVSLSLTSISDTRYILITTQDASRVNVYAVWLE